MPIVFVHGVRFRCKQAAVPSGSEVVEALTLGAGPALCDRQLRIGEARFQRGPRAVSFGKISCGWGSIEAVDLVWDIASAVASPAKGYGDVADGYTATSLRWSSRSPWPRRCARLSGRCGKRRDAWLRLTTELTTERSTA